MSTFVPASRVSRIKVSPSTAAAARARELKAAGRDIVDLTVGEPDFDTPDNIKAAAHAAIDRGETKYTAVNGTPALRKAIIGDFKRRLGLSYADDEICVGGGAKQILFLALMASVENDAEVIIPAPYWVSYPDMVIANEGKPVIVECPQETGFKLTPEALEKAITPKTLWLVLNAPSNPTGAAYDRRELEALGEVLLRHPHVFVLSDDIYDQVWFKDEPMTTLVAAVPELKERVLLTNGVSKSYAMTGWRIGYGAGPAALIAAINKLQSQMSSCPSSVSQAAAAYALSSDQAFVAESVKVYKERRDYACARLNAVPGLSCLVPDGAFYLFPNCAGVIGKKTPEGKTIETDLDFVLYLLDGVGVAALQGAAYGVSPHFRLSIATSMETITQACDRIERAVAELR
ncbi:MULTISPECIES: aspartate transaminase [Rhizobium]|jgi:aspartate aminotransferase|uniref:Aminotransferase n=1 Tax=Rhizobium anhuiense TaxID=1184720 RepID=A0A432NLS5_9HYPH|nr:MULTISPECIES: aspartate transaminase [Rhizobium]MBB3301673.1 aspartate aminotransferase [Rhizobium sp. BK112]MBB3370857.1 aspartate aminotransferase [Rhizobium sp. BK077]MBB3746818.1 aspartate aminotransferase [Rhizobium sp. BK591]MBB4115455.1 aspartate aminotransferase [Rhizobium sp. BK226]MBB4181625.1 aspartate aminotransferase [Rhizobium sp. BK109]